MDASSHRSLDERTNVLIFNGSLVLHHSALSITIDGRYVLKIAFTTLITDRAVEGMVSQ
jgi:hypothetical protein